MSQTREAIAAIFSVEHTIARESALAVIVGKPSPVWQSAIPGMFIFDFLKRTAAIRKFSSHYMFPRTIAADIVSHFSGREEIAGQTGQWITDNHPGLAADVADLVELLSTHYTKLVLTDMGTFPDMITAAYPDRDAYGAFLEALDTAEQTAGNHAEELAEAAERRRKHADGIFNG